MSDGRGDIVQLDKWEDFEEHVQALAESFPNSRQQLEFFGSPLWLEMLVPYNIVKYELSDEIFLTKDMNVVIMSYYNINFRIQNGRVV